MGSTATKATIGEDFVKMKESLEKEKPAEAAKTIQNEMDTLDSTTLHIAITGSPGAGKTSVVAVLRGFSEEKDSTKSEVAEGARKAQPYPHPKFPNVTFWDLPDFGTDDFKADEYLEQVDFEKYDFFIIVTSDCFSENDVKLAYEIKKRNKMFYYVRTDINTSLDSERGKPNFSEAKTIRKIRNTCLENLKQAGEDSTRVFLISGWDLSKYDFPLLQKTLEEDLDDLKRHRFTAALPAFSKDIIEKKRADLLALIWKLALLSCVLGVVPIPGMSVACNLMIVVGAMIKMHYTFALDEVYLRSLEKHTGIPMSELKSAIKKTPAAGVIDRQFVIDSLRRSTLLTAASGVQSLLYFIPILGSVTGGAISLLITNHILKNFLAGLVEDSENVLAKAQEKKAG